MPLNPAELIQQNQHEYTISGAVDFLTAPALVQTSLDFFKGYKSAETVTVDLSKVSSCNSAGLALMLEMVKNAQKNNITLRFENLPDTLLTIAKAYGVEKEIRDICK